MHIFFPSVLMRLFSKSVSFCLIVSHFLKIRTLTKIQLSVLTTRSHISHARSGPGLPLFFIVINSPTPPPSRSLLSLHPPTPSPHPLTNFRTSPPVLLPAAHPLQTLTRSHVSNGSHISHARSGSGSPLLFVVINSQTPPRPAAPCRPQSSDLRPQYSLRLPSSDLSHPCSVPQPHAPPVAFDNNQATFYYVNGLENRLS